MFRILLAFFFVSAAPLAAQSTDSAEVLRSGSTVRLHLRDAPLFGSVGAVLAKSGDTLRVITPELGLAEVAVEDVERLEVPSSIATKTFILIAASAAAGAAVGLVQGEGIVESLAVGTAMAVVIALPATASERRRWRPIDPAAPWRGDAGGARVRVSAPALGFDDAELVLHDFRGGTLYLRDGQVPKPAPVAQVTRLELSIGRDRRRGVKIGSAAGAIAGLLYGINRATGEGGEPISLLPVMAIGFWAGGSVGGLGGFLLAPREWRRIPLPDPSPPLR
jgi:hypothetical protein